MKQHANNDARQTIQDFGAQWQRFRGNDGYYACGDMFADVVGPFLTPKNFEDKYVVELGSGTGRIVSMMLKAGARQVTAVELSDAFYMLKEDFSREQAERITCVRAYAKNLPEGEHDLILSIGVMRHIPEPDPAIARAFQHLRPGGRILVWFYGREGNAAYLSLFLPLRKLTSLMPDVLLVMLSHVLTAFLSIYAGLCRVLPLPMRKYMLEVISRYPWRHRMLTVFDQLNPGYAKYYTRDEAEQLLKRAGFSTWKPTIGMVTAGR